MGADVLEHFLNRERELHSYRAFMRSQASLWVLNIVGGSGTSKSLLLRRLCLVETPSGSPKAWLDLDRAALRSDPLALLRSLAEEFRWNMEQKAWEAFHSLQIQEEQALARLPLKLTIKQAVPTAGGVVSNIKQSVQASSLIRQSQQRAQSVVTSALIDALETVRPRPLVVFIDTFDRLQEAGDHTYQDWLLGELFAYMHKRLRSGLKLIVASQKPLEYSPLDGYMTRLEIGNFSSGETAQMLRYHDILKPDLHRAAFEMTRGHPLLTDVLGRVWKEQEEQALLKIRPVPKWRETFEEAARREWVLGHIIKRLDKPMADLLRYGVILRAFNLDTLRGVFPELALSESLYEQFTSYPFVMPPRFGLHAFHELVRSVQTSYLRRHIHSAYKRYHRRALSYFREQITETKDEELLRIFKANTIYHQMAIDEEVGLTEWNQATQDAQIRWDRQYWGELLNLALDPALSLSSSARALTRLRQGDYYVLEAKWEEAEKQYQLAQSLALNLGNKMHEAHATTGLGDVNFGQGRYDVALDMYEHAKDMYQMLDHISRQAEALISIANVFLKRGEYVEAYTHYKSAHALFKDASDAAGEASALYGLGDVHYVKAEYQQAIEKYQLAGSIYAKIGANFEYANSLRSLGDVHLRRGDYDLALDAYEEAAKVYDSLNAISVHAAAAHRGIGDIYLRQGAYERASERYERAKQFCEQIGDKMAQATILLRLGDVAKQGQEYSIAMERYGEARTLYQQLGGQIGVANSLMRMGEVCLGQEKYVRAKEFLNAAMEIYTNIDGRLGQANVLKALADLKLAEADYNGALDHYKEAQRIYDELGVRLGVANTHKGLGDVYTQMERPLDALQEYEKALDLYRSLSNKAKQEVVRKAIDDLSKQS